MMTRRATLVLAAGGLAAAALPFRGAAQTPFAVPGGQMTLHPVEHASLVIELPEARIAVDPVGAADRYGAAPDLILVTHEHGDHYDAETLAALMGEQTRIVTNPAVFDMLPEALKSRAVALANGESREELGLTIEAIPAYNTTEDRQQYHPQGRDNGYVLSFGDQRLYIAGDTEDTPEMRALTGITVALLPMNLPYTQSVEQAASAVADFQPQIAIPYHHGGTDPAEFARLVEEQGSETQVEILDWYPATDDPAGGDA